MIKILLITGAILLSFFFIVTSFASGFVRGIKLMSTRNIKKSPLEERLLKQFFKQDKNVDAFFYSLYIKDAMNKNTEALKAKHQEQIKKNEKIHGTWENKKSGFLWNAKEEKNSEDKTSIRIYREGSKTKFSSKERFLKNWIKK